MLSLDRFSCSCLKSRSTKKYLDFYRFWAEYDAENDAQISIQNLEHEFVTV